SVPPAVARSVPAAVARSVPAAVARSVDFKNLDRLASSSRVLGGPELNYTLMEKLILADFIVEIPEAKSLATPMEEEGELPEPWILFTGGSSCTDGSRAGLILTNPEGMEFTYALRFWIDATNNEAEYEALIIGLQIAEQIGVKNLQANVNLCLVANQVNETCVAKEADMIRYLEKAHDPSWLNPCGPVIIGLPCAKTLIRACQDCQVHKLVPRNPQKKLTPITSPWPFYKWRIDIAGPFPEGPGKVKFLIVAMDYFTIWIEAKLVVTIIGNQIKRFMWDNIVCSLGEGIKARLDARSKNWMEDLPHVLWAHCTMIKSSNETEAVIIAEISMPTLKIVEVDLIGNNEALEIKLDLLEEKRGEAAIREAKSKAKMEKYYNSKVRNISFKPGDLVYRNNDASRVKDTGKLGPKWKGPYEVTEALGKGAYKLRDRDEKQLPRTWNISNLKKCYIHKM
nr:reverse transcriptase domain-containing protein [Tanacetum cinerariifolium]